MIELKFYKCKVCGKIIIVLKESGTPTICCGEVMQLLRPNTTDGDQEKHVPVITSDKNLVTVTIGETFHPMTPEHHIQWAILQTTRGFQKKDFRTTDVPMANFSLTPDERVVAAYIYCNLHDLWKLAV